MSSPSGTIEITHFSGLYLWEKILWPESSGMISRLTYFAIKNHSAMPSFWPWKNATKCHTMTPTCLNRLHENRPELSSSPLFSHGVFQGEILRWTELEHAQQISRCLSSPMEESHSIFVGDVIVMSVMYSQCTCDLFQGRGRQILRPHRLFFIEWLLYPSGHRDYTDLQKQ